MLHIREKACLQTCKVCFWKKNGLINLCLILHMLFSHTKLEHRVVLRSPHMVCLSEYIAWKCIEWCWAILWSLSTREWGPCEGQLFLQVSIDRLADRECWWSTKPSLIHHLALLVRLLSKTNLVWHLLHTRSVRHLGVAEWAVFPGVLEKANHAKPVLSPGSDHSKGDETEVIVDLIACLPCRPIFQGQKHLSVCKQALWGKLLLSSSWHWGVGELWIHCLMVSYAFAFAKEFHRWRGSKERQNYLLGMRMQRFRQDGLC